MGKSPKPTAADIDGARNVAVACIRAVQKVLHEALGWRPPGYPVSENVGKALRRLKRAYREMETVEAPTQEALLEARVRHGLATPLEFCRVNRPVAFTVAFELARRVRQLSHRVLASSYTLADAHALDALVSEVEIEANLATKLPPPEAEASAAQARDAKTKSAGAATLKPKGERYRPPACRKCGKNSEVASTRKDVRQLKCTSCKHTWQVTRKLM